MKEEHIQQAMKSMPEGKRLMTKEEHSKIVAFAEQKDEHGDYLYPEKSPTFITSYNDELLIWKGEDYNGSNPDYIYAVPIDFDVDKYLTTWK